MEYQTNPQLQDFPDFDLVINRWKKRRQLKDHAQINVYKDIANWSVGKTVLDAGCGMGIGTNIIGHHALGVLGVDIFEGNVALAEQLFGGPKIKFMELDLTKGAERPIGTFDVVACIEVIEHVEDYNLMLEQLKKFGEEKRKTVYFISSPNRNNDKLGKERPNNKHHVREWTAGEFYQEMTKHFQYVTLYATDKPNVFDSSNLVDGDTKRSPLLAKCESPIYTATTA